jgi:hypothetical protein
MIVLAGSGCSFDEAERNLKELCHLDVSNDVVRRLCDEEGQSIQKWMNQSPEPKKAFDAAPGAVEFSTDGLKINTVDGWREIRQSVISKRTPALPAAAEQWNQRIRSADPILSRRANGQDGSARPPCPTFCHGFMTVYRERMP